MTSKRLHILLIIIVLASLACGPLGQLRQLVERTPAPAETREQGDTETGGQGERETRRGGEVTPSPRPPVSESSGVTSRERQAVWPEGAYEVGVTHEQDGLTFTVREMRIAEEVLAISWEAVNLGDKALELKSADGRPPLLQDNTGRVYEYPAWPEGEVLAIEPGEKIAGEWRFGLPAFDAYRLRLGINLLRSVVPVALPGEEISFWSEPWPLPNPDWPKREKPGQANDVAEVTMGKLTVAIESVHVAPTHVAIDVVAMLAEGDIEETVTLAWTTQPELRGERRYVLDGWSLDDWPEHVGRVGALMPGQSLEGEFVFYPAPQKGESLTLTFNPKPVLENQPTVILSFVAP
ncbi:MAG: hypothetical protein H8D78_08645 [Chloroflexi bacterium]|nr:hypothetical protein [Chloroflexota bacterium]